MLNTITYNYTAELILFLYIDVTSFGCVLHLTSVGVMIGGGHAAVLYYQQVAVWSLAHMSDMIHSRAGYVYTGRLVPLLGRNSNF